MKRYWIVLMLFVLLQACGNEGNMMMDRERSYNTEELSNNMPVAEPSMDAGIAYDQAKHSSQKMDMPISSDRKDKPSKQPDKIIKTGRISIEVEDYSKTLAALKNTIARMDGYISSENEQRNNYNLSNTIVIRVVNANFDKLMDGIASEAGKLLYKNVDLMDVTEELTDLTARMKTKKEVEQRYIDILRTARTVKDILLVEEQLRVIREEIESAEARLKYLGDKVQFSTITLDMRQELDYNPPAPMQVSFFDKLGKAVKGGWNGLLGGVLSLVNAWPIVLVIIVVLALIRRWVKKRAALKVYRPRIS